MENEVMDYGYGFDSNGGPIDESTIDEFYRIATHEIVDKSEIANYAVVDIKAFLDIVKIILVGFLTKICLHAVAEHLEGMTEIRESLKKISKI